MSKMKRQTPFKSVHLKEYGLVIMEHAPQSAEVVSESFLNGFLKYITFAVAFRLAPGFSSLPKLTQKEQDTDTT